MCSETGITILNSFQSIYHVYIICYSLYIYNIHCIQRAVYNACSVQYKNAQWIVYTTYTEHYKAL